MKTTFTDIHWRNQVDSDMFNAGALKSITLEGMSSGIITIDCVANEFKMPYYGLHFGGGVEHYECTIKDPYKMGDYLELAIFENKVAIAHHSTSVPAWFEYKCKTSVFF